MPRRPRVALAGVPAHVIQRGHNRDACFFADEDFALYLDQLAELAGNFALGGDRFKKQIEAMLGRRVSRKQRGPPRKAETPSQPNGDLFA